MKKILLALLTLAIPLCAGTISVEKYSNNSSLQWVWAVSSLRSLELQGNESILDIGCGDGKITSLLACKVPQGSVIGIEPFPECIEFAQKKYLNSNLTFETYNAFNLPYTDQFDVVTSFLTLNWLQDYEAEATFSQIAKALKSGGVALLTIPAPAKDNTWRVAFQKIMNSDQLKPHLSLFEFQNRAITAEKIQDWVGKAGLKLDEIAFIETPMVYHDRLEVKEWLNALNPRLDQMPPENFNYFVDAYIRFISMIYPQAGDSRIYVFPEQMRIKISKLM